MAAESTRAFLVTEPAATPTRRGSRLLALARRKPLGAVSLVVLVLLVAVAAAAPLITPYDPNEPHPRDRLQPPSATYYLGTDTVGRDMFGRLVYGARISLQVGLISVLVGTLGGAAIGLVSGFWGGKLDMVMQRLVDSVMAFPGLVLVLLLMAVLGRSVTNVMIAIGILIAPAVARVMRGAVLSTKAHAYVDAARALGASDRRLLWRHIVPNVMAPIIVLASVQLGAAVLTEASLSFLGLGPPPPTPSWGSMLSGSGRREMEHAMWLAWAPAVAISVTVLAFNLFGDALRDVLDPRLRGSR